MTTASGEVPGIAPSSHADLECSSVRQRYCSSENEHLPLTWKKNGEDGHRDRCPVKEAAAHEIRTLRVLSLTTHNVRVINDLFYHLSDRTKGGLHADTDIKARAPAFLH